MSSLFDPDRPAERLPVSLITGFLGSGKTTLLNRLVQRPELADSLVIINEFGEIALDHLLVAPVEGESRAGERLSVLRGARRSAGYAVPAAGRTRQRRDSGISAGADRDVRACRPGTGRAAVPEQPAAGLLPAPRCDCRDDRCGHRSRL